MNDRVIHELVQGTPEWARHRFAHYNASEAAAMLGLDPKLSRAELVRMYAIGNEREFSDFVQRRVLDKGHEAEAAARSIAERKVGEDLFPVTVSREVEGLPLSASPDGATMDETIGWEHKLANPGLMEALGREEIPEQYRPQLEQQLLVTGAQRCLFMASDELDLAAVWYESDPALRARLIAGWRQFREDVAAYQHVEDKPAPAAAPIEALPELQVAVVGEVRSTNLATWREIVLARIKAIKTDLATDEDFAQAEKTVKFLEDGEKKLALAKAATLAQTVTIDELFRTVDHLAEEMRAKRLTLDKLVKARKESIRAEIIAGGREAFAKHVEALNIRIGRPFMPAVLTDFAGCVKGLKTVKSVRDAVDGELARAKLSANEAADRIQLNLSAFVRLAESNRHQFPDLGQLVLKTAEDFAAVVQQRIADNKAAEEKRLAAERERIRQEEIAKLAAAAPAQTPTVAVQACRPEDRIMAATPAGAEMITKAAQVMAGWPSIADPVGFIVQLIDEERIASLEQIDATAYRLTVRPSLK